MYIIIIFIPFVDTKGFLYICELYSKLVNFNRMINIEGFFDKVLLLSMGFHLVGIYSTSCNL